MPLDEHKQIKKKKKNEEIIKKNIKFFVILRSKILTQYFIIIMKNLLTSFRCILSSFQAAYEM